MKKELLAVAAAIALAAGMTTWPSATAVAEVSMVAASITALAGSGGGYAAMRGGAFAGPGWHGGWHGRRFVGGCGNGGLGYGPYYDGY